MFRILKLGVSISVALRKLLQGGRRGCQTPNKLATKGAGSLIIKDLVSRNLTVYVWEDASLWAHWIPSFHMHLSYLGPILFSLVTLLPTSPQLLSNHHEGWWHPLDPSFGSPHAHLEASDISCWLIWQEIFSFHTSLDEVFSDFIRSLINLYAYSSNKSLWKLVRISLLTVGGTHDLPSFSSQD